MRLRWGSVGVAAALVAGAVLLLGAATRTGRYIARAAWEEGKILRGRRSIAKLAADSSTDAVTRGKLQLVLEARAFARDSLQLPARKAFTQYTALAHDTLVLVLSGSARDRLAPVTWWFPVVGRVPYKGFFDAAEGQKEERQLQARGYDTYLRPSPAFSTLGWFNDPLLSTTLRGDSADIANTVVHELTHNRFYAASDAVFNESFANFVGARGAAWFFRQRGDTANAALCDRRWDDEKRLALFWTRLKDSLEGAWAKHPGASGREARLAVRDSVYRWARRMLVDSVGPQLTTYPAWYASRVRLDNAALLARRIYMTDLGAFDAVLDAKRGDLRAAIDSLIAARR